MRIRDVPQRGRRGQLIASRNRAGQYLREQGPVKNHRTRAQQRARGSLGKFARLWNQITEAQRRGWRELAPKTRSRPWQGQSGPLDGPQLFKKLNTVLELCGRPPLLDPPPLPQFGSNPVGDFSIEPARGGYSFKVAVKGVPTEDIMLFAWAPCSAGTAYNINYAFIGLLPPPRGGFSDFTTLFLKKLKEWRKLKDKRYQVPLPGSKVFIRAWQQVNGWENRTFARLTSALVPAYARSFAGRANRTYHAKRALH
jgi:hypothetical protein